MGALLNNFPMLQHNNVVGVLNRAQPMRHNHHRLSFVELVQVFHNSPLVVSVKGVGDYIYTKRMLYDFTNQPKEGIICSDCKIYDYLKQHNIEIGKEFMKG